MQGMRWHSPWSLAGFSRYRGAWLESRPIFPGYLGHLIGVNKMSDSKITLADIAFSVVFGLILGFLVSLGI
jgi:hypothetical protein